MGYDSIVQSVWLLSGVALLFLKVVVGYSIFLMFAGAGSIMVGILLALNIVSYDSIITQLCCFFALTVGSALFVYKPLQRLLQQQKGEMQYKNIIGGVAQVHENALTYGKCGHVKWSGSIFKAQIVEDSYLYEIPVDSDVKIVALKQNVLIVRSV